MTVLNRELRSIRKSIRFAPSELERVVDLAHASGRPVASYIRETSLGARPRRKDDAAKAKVIHYLARLGTRLRAVARTANETGHPNAADFDEALSELLETIRQIE